MNSDTIAAVSTAMSPAGIGIVRISGAEAFDIADQIYDSGTKKKKKLKILGIIVTVLGVLAILTCLGVHYPWLTIGIPAIPSLYFDWFSGCIQAFIFCTLTTLFIKQAAG